MVVLFLGQLRECNGSICPTETLLSWGRPGIAVLVFRGDGVVSSYLP